MTVIPEIDTPGHTNAALASYADLFREVGQQSPGDVFHLGGDEAHSTPHSDYLTFVPKASALVTKHGKRVMGWQEIAEVQLPPGSIAQYWGTDDTRSRELARKAAARARRS